VRWVEPHTTVSACLGLVDRAPMAGRDFATSLWERHGRHGPPGPPAVARRVGRGQLPSPQWVTADADLPQQREGPAPAPSDRNYMPADSVPWRIRAETVNCHRPSRAPAIRLCFGAGNGIGHSHVARTWTLTDPVALSAAVSKAAPISASGKRWVISLSAWTFPEEISSMLQSKSVLNPL